MLQLTNPSPRICFVGLQNLPVLAPEYSRAGVGGAERQQTMLARALVRQGFHVSMIVHDYGQEDGRVWDGIRTFKAYAPHAGIPVFRFLHPRWTSVWAAMGRADADIYYVSTAGMLIGEAALFARIHGRKAVYRVANNSDCDRVSKRIRYARDRVLYRYGLRKAHLVLAQTSAQEALLKSNLGRASRVVPSLSDIGTGSRGLEARDISVLWVTNIRPHKRADLLLELARRMPHVQFDMVGGPVNGAESTFGNISKAAQALPNVRFHGYVPYADVATFFERARVFVGTSEMEGFPNTYMQAWARGTPVVAFFDPDSVIARNGLGRAVSTLEEMQSTVQHLLDEPTAWQAASERCRAYIDARLDERTMLEPYIQAFRELSTSPRDVGSAQSG